MVFDRQRLFHEYRSLFAYRQIRRGMDCRSSFILQVLYDSATESYLREKAIKMERRDLSRTYIALSTSEPKVLGYLTLGIKRMTVPNENILSGKVLKRMNIEESTGVAAHGFDCCSIGLEFELRDPSAEIGLTCLAGWTPIPAHMCMRILRPLFWHRDCGNQHPLFAYVFQSAWNLPSPSMCRASLI